MGLRVAFRGLFRKVYRCEKLSTLISFETKYGLKSQLVISMRTPMNAVGYSLQLEESGTCCCSLDENRNVFVGNIWMFKFIVSDSYCTPITVPVSNKIVTLFIARNS